MARSGTVFHERITLTVDFVDGKMKKCGYLREDHVRGCLECNWKGEVTLEEAICAVRGLVMGPRSFSNDPDNNE